MAREAKVPLRERHWLATEREAAAAASDPHVDELRRMQPREGQGND